ncbi:IscS subfamily cysteine desulfurase [Alloalcanivorax xenomutans]|jgi:cysteine desulfurase|uniref:cysteine desulfurase n=1 Tax=Alloalcanivorax xenomutans TaxID=1094342 RepID=A0A9Q3W6W1_9GAMM|nr:IscS subfamily cysteine desulfurase [Alloalcanivorax xenomutans]ARB44972.1 cysteine desulfurase [Alloalcanivorax xenomutans]MCE7508917.1 IscS subfamily cysteine desulfurase [Alloalcanivorax xenomutans]WOD29564.1 IscS subfamily cysteine desulfurase [Alloalcanivorax xenomutans]
MSQAVYLDYAATTPVDPRVVEAMVRFLGPDGTFGNPASRSHLYGWLAEEAVENARRQVADALNADPREIVWTSGATEANNLAIKGVLEQRGGGHVITSATEHKAVLDPCGWLEGRGVEVTYLAPEPDGRITPRAVEEAMREDTVLVSIMHANNETGVINDIGAIGALCRERGVLFHTDAAQTMGKLPLDVRETTVDLVSLCAHKIYGPKGIGALYVRRHPDVRVAAQIHGGGHERGMRSGTLPAHQIVAMGEALSLAMASRDEENERIAALRDRLWDGIRTLPGVSLNGAGAPRLPGHMNVAFEGLEGEMLLTALTGVAVSTGSACTSASLEPSYVLKAMGVSDSLAHGSLRFSVGRFTDETQIDTVIQNVTQVVTRLRDAAAQRG